MGYADGYPRHASNGTPVIVNHQAVPLIGNISMDMLAVDLTDLPDARSGDEVILWGQAVTAKDVANSAGTIPYQLLCNLNRVLVQYQP